MGIDFATPTAALVALAGFVPLAVVAAVERRNARARAVLGLARPSSWRWALPLAVGLVSVFLGLAAAQPIVHRTQPHAVRLDAEAFVAVDTSRSMKASASVDSLTRMDRARRIAQQIRAAISDVPTGIGTFTDRPLPLLLPTLDRDAFAAVVRQSLGIERPPGLQSSVTISSFDAVAPYALEGYFAPSAKKRLLVILTDAESTGFNEAGVRKSFEAKPRTAVVVVRIGHAGEQVFGADGRAESTYIPPPATGATLREFLAATHGRAFSESQVDSAVQAARGALGSGPTATLGSISGRHDLAPWLVLAAVFPLGFVLRRRNF